MAKLLEIEKLVAGGDPRENWRKINEIIDAINDITFEVTPDDAGDFKVSEGTVLLELDVITSQDAVDSIPGYAPPGTSEEAGGAGDNTGGAGGDSTAS